MLHAGRALRCALAFLLPLPLPAQSAEDPRAQALAAFQRDERATAERLLGGWLEGHPDDGEAWGLLGMMRLVTAQERAREGGEPEEIRQLASRVVEPLRRAELLADEPIPDLDHGLGWALLMQGRHAEACERFDRALAASPKAELLRLRATCALELGRYAEAERDLSRLEGTPADEPEARRLHARALFLQGREREARDLLARYLERSTALPAGERFETLMALASYSRLMLELDAAREALETACPLKPGDAGCHAALGRALFRLGRVEAAAEELEAAVSGAASDRVFAEAQRDLGLIALTRGDAARARDHFESSLEREPISGESLQGLANALRRLGETRAAREALARFEEVSGLERELARVDDRLLLTPGDHAAAAERVRLLLKLRRRDEAARRLEELRSRAPEHPGLEALERQLADAR
jgi:tetratricopeptide (TPR) repeat protein